MGILVTNDAATTLSAGITALDTALSLTSGAKFPTYTTIYPTVGYDYSYGVLEDVLHNIEIVKIINRAGNLVTVQRAQEGTTALAFPAGSAFEIRTTVQTVLDLANGLTAADIGVLVQAFDADTAKTDVEQTWAQVQRTNENIGTSLTLDLDATYLDFRCTPAAGGALTFSNIPASPLVQKGTIVFINGSNYAITAGTGTKVTSSLLSTISATGTYLINYRTSNGNVYLTTAGAQV